MSNAELCTKDNMEEVLNMYSNLVYRLALTRTKNKADAEDVYQEVFLRYIKYRKGFCNECHRKSWFIKVTLNCSRKLFSSAWFRHTVPLEENLRFDTKEKSEIYNEVMNLPLKYKTVIHLYYYNDLSISQISNILSLKESTIKTQLFRARQILKSNLEVEFN